MNKNDSANKAGKVCLILSLILVLLGFIGSVSVLANPDVKSLGVIIPAVSSKVAEEGIHNLLTSGIVFPAVLNLISCVLIVIYAAFEYKKPHGNMLKGIFYVFSLCIIAKIIVPGKPLAIEAHRYVLEACTALASVTVAFIGGRLNKIDKNEGLMIFAALMLAICGAMVVMNYGEFHFMRFFSIFTPLFCHIALCLAYVVRYDQHKNAGLEKK